MYTAFHLWSFSVFSLVYHAIYLDFATAEHLSEKVAGLYNLMAHQISQVHIQAPSGIRIMVTDAVSASLFLFKPLKMDTGFHREIRWSMLLDLLWCRY